MSESQDRRRAPKRQVPKKVVAGMIGLALIGAEASTGVDMVQRDNAANQAARVDDRASDMLQQAHNKASIALGIARGNAEEPAAFTTRQEGGRKILNTDGMGEPLPAVIGYDLSPNAEASLSQYGEVAKIDGEYVATPDVSYTNPTDGSLPEPFVPADKLDDLAAFNKVVQDARVDALPGIEEKIQEELGIAEENARLASKASQQAIENQRYISPL